MENLYKKIRKIIDVIAKIVLKHKTIFILAIMLAISIFFRLWQLDIIPPGLYPDVAINGNDALNTIETGQWKLFYQANNGREGLFMWLIAISFSIFGTSVWAIKIVAATIGILTVFGVYLLTKELCAYLVGTSFVCLPDRHTTDRHTTNYSSYIALLASFFLAISFWHTMFSRIGFRAIMVPFFLVFGFYFLFRGFRKAEILPIFISSIFFGLGFYTYIAYRFVIIPLTVVLVYWFLIYRKQGLQKKFLIFNSLFIILVLVVALPIGIYFLQNPADFFGRANAVSIFSQPNPTLKFLESFVVNLGIFNFYGDGNWRHNIPRSPQLLWPVGIFFLIGFILLIKEIIIRKKNINEFHIPSSRFYVPIFLFAWFFAMLLPSALTYEGIPHNLRIIGMIPPIFIFAGIGAFWTYEKIKPLFKTKNQKALLALCVSVFLFSVLCAEWSKYFMQWGENQNIKDAFSENYVRIGEYLNSLPEETNKYVIVNQEGTPIPFPDGIPVSSQTTMFIERAEFGQLRSEYLLPTDINKIEINNKKAVIIPLHYEKNLFEELSEKFPNGKIIQQNGIYVYEISITKIQ